MVGFPLSPAMLNPPWFGREPTHFEGKKGMAGLCCAAGLLNLFRFVQQKVSHGVLLLQASATASGRACGKKDPFFGPHEIAST